MTRYRGGFALLTVLWVMLGVSVLALTITTASREMAMTARNRIALAQAYWRAEGCIELTRAEIAHALTTNMRSPARLTEWAVVREAVRGSSLVSGCGGVVTLRPTGMLVDVNSAGEIQLRRLFRRTGIDSLRTDSLVAAILDWRDADDVPRSHGAEREWYQQHGMHPPRNGPFASTRELELVRGVAGSDSLESILTVEPGKVAIRVAPLAIIASLPGITDEFLAALAEQRRRGEMISQLSEPGGQLSAESRRIFQGGYRELVTVATVEPEAWILTATARAGNNVPQSTVELRLVSAGLRSAIMRRRTWP